MTKRKIALLSAVGLVIAGLAAFATLRGDSLRPGGNAATANAQSGSQSVVDGGLGEGTKSGADSTITDSEDSKTEAKGQVPDDPFPEDFALGTYKRRHPDDDRPEGCTLKTGLTCQITFTGTYRLTNGESAFIGLGAYEDGSATRASGGEIKVQRGVNRWYIVYNYGIKATKTVQFKIQLLSTDHKVLYEHALKVLPLDE